ncbi:aminodeoxychorismate lyase, partial [Salmonella enterica subsp. enterica serovar Newport]|nr:aminodeoxychorismate lyase [Salmonella enterica subsp. enterica serovar Newport]
MYLINGQSTERLAVNDRGVQFGDGCFTTARIAAGEIALFSRHLARLEETCSRLAIPFNDWDALVKEMRCLAQPHREGVLKVMITRGAG